MNNRTYYVYWTVHHLDSWVKRDKLDATCLIITLFSAQHVSDVNTSILRSVWLIRWVTSCVVSGSMCVGVTLQCGYGGVVSVCRLKHCFVELLHGLYLVRCVLVLRCRVAMVVWYPSAGWSSVQPADGYHTTIATLQRNTNTHRTRYNPWSNSTN